MKLEKLRQFLEYTKDAPGNTEIFVFNINPVEVHLSSVARRCGWVFNEIHTRWTTPATHHESTVKEEE